MNRSTAARLFVAATLLMCSGVLAREGALRTKNGTVYRGDIQDEGDHYTVTIDKIETPIDKSNVVSVDYTGTIDEQFDQKMRALASKDAPGRVGVARFAFDHGRNDLAIQALSGALQIDPNNTDAIEMLRTVNAQQQLKQNSNPASPSAAAGAGGSGSSVDSATPSPAPVTSQPARHLLTPADINNIRQNELRSDEVVPFNVTPDARKKFLEETGMAAISFSQMPVADQLSALLTKGSDEVKAGTRITRDPMALVEFKRSIHPAILRTCATIGCHAGQSAGSFVLLNGTDEQTIYTNFYIMEQFSQQEKGGGGFFGGNTQRKLIERGNANHSLLINYGLPAGQGEFAHPALPNGASAAIFQNRGTPAYRIFVEWMNTGLNLIEPKYNIKYEIPHGITPTSQPSQQSPSQSAGQSAAPSAGQSAAGSAAQPAAQSAAQPAPQPVRQPAGTSVRVAP